jgi:hypothetical protein
VYRDITDPKFGAKGDGVTDDTAAINAAIAYGGNCGQNCLSSTTTGTFIYFPPGTYLISTPINAYYYSQLVGDVSLARSFDMSTFPVLIQSLAKQPPDYKDLCFFYWSW